MYVKYVKRSKQPLKKIPRTPDQIAIAQKFKKWRTDHGLTQAQVAKMLGVALVTVKHWESGANLIRPATLKMIELLEDTLPIDE